MKTLKVPSAVLASGVLVWIFAGCLGLSAIAVEAELPSHEQHGEDGHEQHGKDDHEQHGKDDHEQHEKDDHEQHEKDDDEGHDEHEDIVRLSTSEIEEFGIEILTASAGQLPVHVELAGEIVINPDRLAHIVPRVPGVARAVYKQLGDRVKAGEVLAMLESRELSELKSAYLVAKARMVLAQTTFAREEELWKSSISSEREYLDVQKSLAEAQIAVRATEQKLHALGFSDSYLARLNFSGDEQFTRYEMTAPFAGAIVGKHISLGEMLKDDAEAFVVADLSSVWVNFAVYQSDLPSLYEGQKVRVAAGVDMSSEVAPISYISPVIDEATRTAWARVVLPNQSGLWRPGTFVTGEVVIESIAVAVVVPKVALQTVEEQTVLFVETNAGFEKQPVALGRANSSHVEITAGLSAGQRYVARGSFVLKSQLAKGAFGDGHNH
jgi:membrane fusion protein, heavy metal efflux system